MQRNLLLLNFGNVNSFIKSVNTNNYRIFVFVVFAVVAAVGCFSVIFVDHVVVSG